MPYHNSRIPGFYQLTLDERIERIGEYFELSSSEVDDLRSQGALRLDSADRMIESVIGVYSLPIGLGLNLRVNGKDHLVPMAVEEASIVAAVSYGSKIVRRSGGFTAEVDEGIMIGQVSVMGLPDPSAAGEQVLAHKADLLKIADASSPRMKERGGGARDIEVRIVDEPGIHTPGAYEGPFLVVHLLADCLDAMGANLINTMVEAIAPKIVEITNGGILMRILSNLADRRMARAEARIDFEAFDKRAGLGGEELARRIATASHLAQIDPYRAATHNKGVMNGIDAIAVATGNDWRSIESAAHAYASRDGHYRGMAHWWVDSDQLVGRLELPMAVGIVGGNIAHHPMAQLMLRFLRTHSSRELAGVMVASGLAQNLGALRALVSEGIQEGHMALHARSVALSAGATAEEADELIRRLIKTKEITVSTAEKVLAEMRSEAEDAP